MYIIILIITVILTSCTNNKKEAEIIKKDRAPDSISDVSSNIQDILKNTEKIEQIIEGTYIEEETEEQKFKDEKSTDNMSKEKEKSDGNKDSNSNEDMNKSKESDKEKQKNNINEELKKTWEEIEKKLEDTHEKWNSYESQGIKKGMTIENADLFRNSLNDLTKSIENKNIKDIYNFGAESFLNLSSIFNLYRDEIQGEIDKIRYVTYKSYLMAINKEISKGEIILEDGEKTINLLRLKIKEDDEKKIKLLERLQSSVLDMKKSLSKESIKLNRIKKDVIIQNLRELNN